MPHTVTLRDLADLNANPKQITLFASTFPEGVTIDVDNYRAVALAMVEVGFDTGWYACHALTDDEWGDYDAVVSPAWAAYCSAVTRAWVAYDAAVTLTWAYEAAEAAYEAAEAQAQTASKIAQAEALCAILARRGA